MLRRHVRDVRAAKQKAVQVLVVCGVVVDVQRLAAELTADAEGESAAAELRDVAVQRCVGGGERALLDRDLLADQAVDDLLGVRRACELEHAVAVGVERGRARRRIRIVRIANVAAVLNAMADLANRVAVGR